MIPHRGGLPHSDTSGSTPARGSPKIFAACHVLLRLLAPRHPPDALLLLKHPSCSHTTSLAQDPSNRGQSPGVSSQSSVFSQTRCKHPRARRIGSNHTHTSHPRTHTGRPAETNPPTASSLHPSRPVHAQGRNRT